MNVKRESQAVQAIGLAILLALLAGCLLDTGCTTTLQNQGEYGFRYGTEFTFFHRAAKTTGGEPGDVAKSNTEFPALVEWLLPGPPPPGAVTPPQ